MITTNTNTATPTTTTTTNNATFPQSFHPNFDKLEQRIGELRSETQRKGNEIRRLRGSTKQGAAERRVVWDEATIAEHDKERGTRMRIDEPKTPFHHGNGSFDGIEFQDEDIPFMSLAGNMVNITPPLPPVPTTTTTTTTTTISTLTNDTHSSTPSPQPLSLNLQDVSEELDHKLKHEEFERLRKQHYNMKAALSKKPVELDDEDDDNNDQVKTDTKNTDSDDL
jgi:protein phosphatase inhibitor 2